MGLYFTSSITLFHHVDFMGNLWQPLSLLSLWCELGFVSVGLLDRTPQKSLPNNQQAKGVGSCALHRQGDVGTAILGTQVLLGHWAQLLPEHWLHFLFMCQTWLPGSIDSHSNSCLIQRQECFSLLPWVWKTPYKGYYGPGNDHIQPIAREGRGLLLWLI